MPTTLRGRLVIVVLLTLLPVLPGAAASAHSALVGSTPETGSTIRALPEHVELRFNERLSDIEPAIILRSGGETVATLEPEVDGRVLRAASPGEVPDGRYTLVWRVVSADGHPIDGVVPFTVGSADGDEPTATAPARRSAPEASNGVAAVVLAVAAPVALLLAGGWWFLRRRPNSDTTPEKDPS